MNWSFRIARVAGIAINVHITFFLILALGAFQWGVPYGVPGAAFGVLLMLLLFLCVTLHELGHSLVAQRFGIPVRQIILLPLGGVALLSRNPSKPVHELLIAAAGPLVNVVIALLLWLVTQASAAAGGLTGQGLVPGLERAPPSLNTLLAWLLAANVSLVVFNLIPAFPLDGGRILRALLAMRFSFQRATRIASGIGQALAILLGVLGVLSGNLVLVLVAVFIFFGAGQENVAGQAQTVLTTQRVGDAYNKHALTLEANDRLSTVVDYILTSYQPDFAVLQGNTLVGVVLRSHVLQAMASNQQDISIATVMDRKILRVEASASLDDVRQTLAGNQTQIAAVYDGSAYLGLVSLDDIAEALMLLRFRQDQQQPGQPQPQQVG